MKFESAGELDRDYHIHAADRSSNASEPSPVQSVCFPMRCCDRSAVGLA